MDINEWRTAIPEYRKSEVWWLLYIILIESAYTTCYNLRYTFTFFTVANILKLHKKSLQGLTEPDKDNIKRNNIGS